MKKLAIVGMTVAIGLFGISSAMSSLMTISHTNNSDAVIWAHERGMTKFDTWTNFGADMAITREQAAKMLSAWIVSHRELQWPWTDTECTFDDETTIDPSLTQSVSLACHYGLFKGFQGNFMPKQKLKAQDARTLMLRAQAILEEHDINIEIPSFAGFYLTRGNLIESLYALHTYIDTTITEREDERLATTQTDLDLAMQTWKGKNIASYQAQQKISCFCGPNSTHPITFDVARGVAVKGSIQDVSDTDPVPAKELQVQPKTVEELFTLIQNAIDNRAENITVSYDAELGYPTHVGIDQSYMIADEEIYYNYEILQTY